MIRGWPIQKHSTATWPKQNSVIDFPLPLLAAAAIRVKSVSRQWDPMKGAIGAGKKQSALKGIHILPLLLAWIYIWIDSHCTPGCPAISSWSGNPAAKLHLQRCSGLNRHTLTLPKPSSHCHLALHNPASFPLPRYFLTDMPLFSQHVNNVKKTVLFVFT